MPNRVSAAARVSAEIGRGSVKRGLLVFVPVRA
jgi:hypothetical protein